MKKLLLLLAAVLAFTLTGVAQTSSSSSAGQSDQAATGKSKAKKDASADQAGATDTGKKSKAKKESTLTGCISTQPDASGNYTLSNAKHKKGVKIGPADKVKEHAGHQTQLTGQWSGTGADKSFEVASVKHISETCEAAPGGGTAGTTRKGKKDAEKGKETSAPPKS